MNEQQIQAVADAIVAQNLARKPYAPLPAGQRSDDLADAYRIQQQVYAKLGEQAGWGPLGGHKIALTSPAIQQLVGLDTPIYGAVFDSQIYSSGHQIRLGDYQRLGLEFEIAVRMAKDTPAQKTPYTAEDMAEYIDAVMPAFELIEDRAADYDQLDAFSLVADRCWCGGTVVGEPTCDLGNLDLGALPSRAMLNGELLESANTGLAMGHPFNGLAWVANFLADQGRMLRAGELIITGSAVKTYYVSPGDRVQYEVDGLGSVTVEVAA